MFIAMNNFKVNKGREAEFEESWRTRKSHLDEVPGFVEFALLKGDASAEHAEYSSHTVWASREAFVAWTQSPAFAAGHRQGSVAGVLAGPPQVKVYDAVLVQKAPALKQ